MRTIILPLILLLTFLLQGCVPEVKAPSGRKLLPQSDTDLFDWFDFDDEEESTDESKMSWYSNGVYSSTNGSITVNQSTTDGIYIRGEAIEFYLNGG